MPDKRIKWIMMEKKGINRLGSCSCDGDWQRICTLLVLSWCKGILLIMFLVSFVTLLMKQTALHLFLNCLAIRALWFSIFGPRTSSWDFRSAEH